MKEYWNVLFIASEYVIFLVLSPLIIYIRTVIKNDYKDKMIYYEQNKDLICTEYK